jgi:hypothetical protein
MERVDVFVRSLISFCERGIIGAKATNGRNAHEETCSAPFTAGAPTY